MEPKAKPRSEPFAKSASSISGVATAQGIHTAILLPEKTPELRWDPTSSTKDHEGNRIPRWTPCNEVELLAKHSSLAKLLLIQQNKITTPDQYYL